MAEAARDILQRVVDEVGATLMTGDWDTYAGQVLLPFTLQTGRATMVIETVDDLREGFNRFHEMIVVQKLTDYIRLVETAQHTAPDMIEGIYVSHLMRHAHRVVEPYRSTMWLREVNGRWKIPHIRNELNNASWPLLTPRPPKRGT
jgi:hypothetical protein